ncbi:MAG: L-lactate permease [Chloroflexota bacterium]
MFHQVLDPVAHNLFFTFVVGFIPIATVLVLLGIVRAPAWIAALAGLVIGFLIAVTIWQMPVGLAFRSALMGGAFALWPVMWIVVNALLLYNIAVRTGHFDAFRRWMVFNVPPDRRILMLVVAFSFGALLEGIAGFGAPVAISAALLIALGFEALEAVTIALIFNTAPVAFGALGVPITTLGAVTGLPVGALSSMVGRQLPLFAFLLPFYALIAFTGFRGLRGAWPVALVAGLSFALTQFFVSNYIGQQLPDVLASLVSLICVVVFVKVWQPKDIEDFRVNLPGGTAAAATRRGSDAMLDDTGSNTPIGERDIPRPAASRELSTGAPDLKETILGWLPWVLVSAVVIFWVEATVAANARQLIAWPGLDNKIFLTLYHKPYAAVYTFEPLGTGTAILVATIITTIIYFLVGRARPEDVAGAIADTFKQLYLAIITVAFIVALAFLFNYSGMAYSLGLAISNVGSIYPFFAAFLGWIACFLSGSDTSSNALFGNLQATAARQLKLSPVLMAATNSSGAVMSKMISPQNVTTGASTIGLAGKEGSIIRRTFIHSIILEVLLGIVVMIQQYWIPGIIPK